MTDLIDRLTFQDNWWAPPLVAQDKRDPDEEGYVVRPTVFLDAGSRRQATEHRRLHEAGLAGAFMARAIVEGAGTHATDPRLPEALYRAVRATRFAGGGEWSRRAHALIHKQFPRSPLAKRTTFWY